MIFLFIFFNDLYYKKEIHIDRHQCINYHLFMKTLNDKRFAAKIKIISDATRLSIIRLLASKGIMCACKILEELHITQGTLSHHMNVLANAKLISCRKDGKWRHYCLIPNSFCELATYIQEICHSQSNCADESFKCNKEDSK